MINECLPPSKPIPTLYYTMLEPKGVIPVVCGGLGNQIFTMTASYIAAKQLRCPLYILKNRLDNNKHNRNKFDYNASIFRYFGEVLAQENTQGFIQYLYLTGYEFYNFYQPPCFEAWSVANRVPGLLMNGYYQFYPAIQPHEQEIATLVLRGLHQFRETLQTKTTNWSTSAFVHVRRGDYLEIEDHLSKDPLSYYAKALEELQKKQPQLERIVVVSDDIDWVKQQPLFTTNHLVSIEESLNELETLSLMSLCCGGAIIANSTFSWWGAFLGSHLVKSPIIAPSQWYRGSLPPNILPSSWLVL